MPLEHTCGCALCQIERSLLSELSAAESHTLQKLFSKSGSFRECASVSVLLARLKAGSADPQSDELFRELLAARDFNSSFTDGLLVLAFLPMLHGTVRRVARQQPELAPEDISQQALIYLLQYLGSGELQSRESYFAFAISRAVKRLLFEWASRESETNGRLNRHDSVFLARLAHEESFERYAFLRHFLNRCVTRGSLTDAELNLLIDFKLNGTNGADFADLNGTSSNAIRQKLKRLLTKLRRLAK
ncbi:MAG TPA: hypothetical protein VGD60_01610 [Candidatus Acidoferrales bacterium]